MLPLNLALKQDEDEKIETQKVDFRRNKYKKKNKYEAIGKWNVSHTVLHLLTCNLVPQCVSVLFLMSSHFLLPLYAYFSIYLSTKTVLSFPDAQTHTITQKLY